MATYPKTSMLPEEIQPATISLTRREERRHATLFRARLSVFSSTVLLSSRERHAHDHVMIMIALGPEGPTLMNLLHPEVIMSMTLALGLPVVRPNAHVSHEGRDQKIVVKSVTWKSSILALLALWISSHFLGIRTHLLTEKLTKPYAVRMVFPVKRGDLCRFPLTPMRCTAPAVAID
jgi:hypothetical protein